MLNNSNPVTMAGPPHYVDLHVNPGESVSILMLDGNEHILRGPATITMVSQHATPPVPMPVQVPPGHMIQQIVDENGTLKHIILSALNNSGQNGPTALLMTQQPPTAFGPYGCCCCCYCSGGGGGTGVPGVPNAALSQQSALPPQMATLPNGLLAFPGHQQLGNRRRNPSRTNNFAYSKRSAVTNNQNATMNSSSPFLHADLSGSKSSPSRVKIGLPLLHPDISDSSDSKDIIQDEKAAQQTKPTLVTPSPGSELITNGSLIVQTSVTKPQKQIDSSSVLQFNYKPFEPKSSNNMSATTAKTNSSQLDTFPHSSSLSVSPTSTVDSSVGYSSDKYSDDFQCNGSITDSTVLSNGSCNSRASSSSPLNDRRSDHDQLNTLTGELLLADKLNAPNRSSNGSDLLVVGNESIMALQVSTDSLNGDCESRTGSELNMEVDQLEKARRLSGDCAQVLTGASSSTISQSKLENKSTESRQASPKKVGPLFAVADLKTESKQHEQEDKQAVIVVDSKASLASTASPKRESPSKKSASNQRNVIIQQKRDSVECKLVESVHSVDESSLNVTTVCTSVSPKHKSANESRSTKVQAEQQQPLFAHKNSFSSPLKKTSPKKGDKKPKDQLPTERGGRGEARGEAVASAIAQALAHTGAMFEPYLSHLDGHFGEAEVGSGAGPGDPEAASDCLIVKDSDVSSLFGRQYWVDMVHKKQQQPFLGTGVHQNGGPDNSSSVSQREVYRGSMNTCRIAHLNCRQEYVFRVKTVHDNRLLVSNLLTITTPELPVQSVKAKKSKQPQHPHQHQVQSHCHNNQQVNQRLHQQSLQSNVQSSGRQQHESSQLVREDSVELAVKSDQRCAIVILALFTLSAIAVAVLLQCVLTTV
ncbi:hypothetical protein HDE_08745 [Halotydeus destructor]|nr:hypothetical protein HDE_08745 [Halotydeus destructor]